MDSDPAFPAPFPWVTRKFPAQEEQGIYIERIREKNSAEQGASAKNREVAKSAELTLLLGPVLGDLFADQARDTEVGTLASLKDCELQFW